ncbi:MAG: hypothetical protein D3904_07545 [Candidatus Electrothrix sp. EH2]|nr:hypothetical protein [Candidatus Electrothrix sp. EH2]
MKDTKGARDSVKSLTDTSFTSARCLWLTGFLACAQIQGRFEHPVLHVREKRAAESEFSEHLFKAAIHQ